VDSTAGGKTVALNDQHDDLSGTFAAAGATLASSATWDPWGDLLATAGPAVELGYQGQWTDPGTGQTDMGSRLYRPSTGGFINADTAPAGNPYAYAGDNPMSLTDLSGNSPSGGGTGNGTVTQADVNAAAAQVKEAQQKAAQAQAAAAQAREAASHAQNTASAARDLARELNDAASQARSAAEAATTAAQQAHDRALWALARAEAATALANSARPKEQLTLDPSLSIKGSGGGGTTTLSVTAPVCTIGGTCSTGVTLRVTLSTGSTSSASQAQVSQVQAQLDHYQADEQAARAAWSAYHQAEAAAEAAQDHAQHMWHLYEEAEGKAQNAQNQANQDTTVAAEMEAEAQRLTQDAANAEAAVTAAENQYQRLKAEYDQEQREEHQKKNQQPAKKQPGTGNSGTAGGAGGGGGCAPLPQLNPRHSLCRQAAAALAGAATAVAKAAAVILSAVLGPVLNTIAGCVTHPTVPGCLAAAGTIILIGSGFADAGADLAAEDTGAGLTRVGRWMSPQEHQGMLDTGMVQEGRTGVINVAHPADPLSFMRQAASGSRYVEFDVPQTSLVQGGKAGWATIPGPDSIFSRLNIQRGLPPYQFPPALNIEWVASKLPPW
jgi:RHS repeat-associated protein